MVGFLTSIIRRFKPAYMLYNVFNGRRLKHNAAAYQKYGLNKSYYSSVSSADFKHLSHVKDASIANDLASRIARNSEIASLSSAAINSLSNFGSQGYAILPGFLEQSTVAAINEEIETLLKNQSVAVNSKNKIMFAHRSSALINRVGNGDLHKVISTLFDDQAILFQSINFKTGSEQATHSDSIHMSTFPLGGLIAAWIALEDIGPQQGPLHYYPTSHKLPYYTNADFDNEGNGALLGDKGYKAYEDLIEDKVQDLGLKKEVVNLKAGDIFLWHANLLHGGEPHIDKNLSRKSMVFHYFCSDRVLYHEITQRPALIEQ